MVGGLAVHAALVLALLVFVELLEAILGVRVVLDVVALVLLDVTLVLEGERAARAPAWDMGGAVAGLMEPRGGPALMGPCSGEGRTLGEGTTRLDPQAAPSSSPDSCLCSREEQGPGGPRAGFPAVPLPAFSRPLAHLQWKCVVFCP